MVILLRVCWIEVSWVNLCNLHFNYCQTFPAQWNFSPPRGIAEWMIYTNNMKFPLYLLALKSRFQFLILTQNKVIHSCSFLLVLIIILTKGLYWLLLLLLLVFRIYIVAKACKGDSVIIIYENTHSCVEWSRYQWSSSAVKIRHT